MYSLRHSSLLLVLVPILLFANAAIAQSGIVLYQAGDRGRCANCHDDGGKVNAPIINQQNEAEWRERLIPGGLRQLEENIRRSTNDDGTPLSNHFPCPGLRYTGVVSANHCNRVIAYMLRQVRIPVSRRAASALYSLNLEGIELSFNPATTSYNINVAHDVANTTVTAVPDNASALITGLTVNGTSTNIADRELLIETGISGAFHINAGITLATGSNAVEVRVSSGGGQIPTIYTINIVRAGSPDATLSSLKIKDIDFTFNPTTTKYNLEVNNDIGIQKRITAMVNNPGARITKFRNVSQSIVRGVPQTLVTEQNISVTSLNRDVVLGLADNLIELEVTAENGSMQNYSITIYKLTTAEQTDRLSGEQIYNQVSCKNCHSESGRNRLYRLISPLTNETFAPQVDMASTATWMRRLRETKETTLNEQIKGLYENVNEGQRYANLDALMKTNFLFGMSDCDFYNNPFGSSRFDKLTHDQCMKIIDYMLAQVGIFLIAESSSDSTLLSLELEDIELAFSSSTTAYNLTVGQDVESTTVTAMVNHPEARITRLTVNGTEIDVVDDTLNIEHGVLLGIGENIIQVEVTAEDDTKQLHRVSIIRPGPPTFVVRVFLEGLLKNQ